jgi:hypothetical protein
MRKREGIFGSLAVLASFVGGCGLILLSIFDTKRHHSLHRAFLLVFILGVAASAIFSIVEVRVSKLFRFRSSQSLALQFRWLSRDFVYARQLKISYITKAIIVGILIVLAIAFAITLYTAKDAGGEQDLSNPDALVH